MMTKGCFITIEGGEGSGKTTMIQKLHVDLEGRGCSVLTTREPGGVEIAENIRTIILDKQNDRMEGRTEALLYAAARRQHMVEKVIPALNEGRIVLCDRFIDSSLAYQGYARGLGIDDVLAINRFAIDGCMPDMTILLDLDPGIGLERIRLHHNREVNRLDLESIDFHRKVRQGYLELAQRFPERIRVIDASQSFELVLQEVKMLMQQCLHLTRYTL